MGFVLGSFGSLEKEAVVAPPRAATQLASTFTEFDVGGISQRQGECTGDACADGEGD